MQVAGISGGWKGGCVNFRLGGQGGWGFLSLSFLKATGARSDWLQVGEGYDDNSNKINNNNDKVKVGTNKKKASTSLTNGGGDIKI